MKVAVFNTKSYDETFLTEANIMFGHELTFLEPRLSQETSILAKDFPGVCVFVNDELNESTLRAIHQNGTRFIALRCAGFNNVDLAVAKELNMRVVRVPAYDPYGVAEHTIGLILSLNRKIHRAYSRVREQNFSI
ncbi:MAG TPA: 2-hydroxyacid dehydrogenase, partial [Allocoleopsis sp.]